MKENLKKYIEISDEVQEALDKKLPIVALESTIISHGMPYPQNLETAIACEDIVRENGSVPATTAIIEGKIKVGLTKDELEFMATDKNILKLSRRDYPVAIANKLNGATTVATSILTASLAGIKILVTGGIGGVHRGAAQTMDISRDLQEVASTDILVVCAGAKSILDIGLTLEYLETHGVPVLGYNTKEMPAFYTRESGYELDYATESPEEIAMIAKTKWDLSIQGGIVIANPISAKDSLDVDVINETIDQAIKEAEKRHITGKEVTPFLLDHVVKATDGTSLTANIALVKNNAWLGSQIAKALHELEKAVH